MSHHEHDERIVCMLLTIQETLDAINGRLDIIMATLDQLVDDVTQENSLIDSISTLLAGIKQQLADALAGTTLPPAAQAKVDAVFQSLEDGKGKLSAAITANTPVASVKKH